MKFLSVCSGIEAASAAWTPLGWQAAAFSEIEPFPCSVLAHHYPDVPNRGDMTKFKEWPDEPINLLCGGTPCQSFSVAGLRAGLDDPRGNLMLTFLAIAAKYRPRWLVWENVPGVLSSNGGRDFGSFLGGLAVLGYGFAYRVLDAQYFGVVQRRRRVFVVGCLGDWRSAASVLFERHSLQGHPAPRRETGKRIAGQIVPGAHPGGFNGQENAGGQLAVAFQYKASASNSMNPSGVAPTMDKGKSDGLSVQCGMQVRRLTPVECEKLQGFPPGYTNVPHRGKPAADGNRYKALGNSWAVPVAAWIGRRIEAVESIQAEMRSAA